MHPGDNQALDTLIADIRNAFADTPPYEGAVSDPIPDLTIGKAPPGDALHVRYAPAETDLKRELPTTVTVETSDLPRGQSDDYWATRAEIPLNSH